MKIIDIWIPAKEIQKRVEHETTDLAKGRTDQQGKPIFDILIMDTDQNLLFRTYFREAAAIAHDKCSAYTKHSPACIGEDDADVTHLDEDFYIILAMPDTFSIPTSSLIDRAIYNHLIAWTIFRWLETKLPNEAQLFRLRSEQSLSDLSTRMERRTTLLQRPYRPI